ncbi:MAG: CHASE2 domain-containing protein [Elusimicrobia bacterium]|nr:CHASE2 domain-containing protein [Elusimicrobiota bacterium]
MKNKGRLLDAIMGLVLTALVAGSYLIGEPFLQGIEFKAYDLRAKLRQDLKPPPEIVLVAIDEDSIAQMGRWPWPRSRMAAVVEKIHAAGPKVIGLNVLYSEPEQNQGLIEVKRLEEKYKELLVSRKISQKGVDFALEFSSSTVAMDSDSKLLAALQASGDVVLPLFFPTGTVGGKPPAVPAAVSSAAIAGPVAPSALEEAKIAYPIEAYSAAAAGLGHVNLYTESDGVLRREAPLVRYGEHWYPSFATRLTMAYLGLKPEDVKFEPGTALTLGKVRVPLDSESRMAVLFNGPQDTIRSAPFANVMSDKVGPEFFKDKIVIVGLTAAGLSTQWNTPVAQGFASLEVAPNVIENILHSKSLTRPPWAEKAELGLIALMGLFIMVVLPRLRAMWGLVVSLVFALALFGAGTYLFMNGQWLQVAYPTVLLLAGYLVIISKSFLVTEKGKELVEASAIETNKMLGLSFQGQGMLDIAFEKFRLCPLDDNMKDTLYNLALDFERKRQFSKAGAVLEHISAKDPKYKDVVEKSKMLKAASEGAVFGGVGGGKKDGTIMVAGGKTKPTLGRYEIEKELGRGAMGVVYLGRDPKINRMVAIKTMMLEEGSDGESTKAVKERFFREAESAGTLNHPNIVRIFDAGDENDVAYIAMELLDGHDLVRYGQKDSLLPVEKALDYIATVADALDYAHAQGIVHRDIKPANVMLLKDGSIRVADFGIARITASSKTATGTVMGTPSYMSPEQVAGKKVDGRSDLFSLAVALYELTTGEKPFKGGDGIGTLLFQIANDPHPDPLTVNPRLPAGLKAVIDKGLAKNPDDRYQRGSEFAAAIRGALTGAPAAAPAPAPKASITDPTITSETAPVPQELTRPLAPAPKPAASERTIGPEITGPIPAKVLPPAPAPAAPPKPAAAEKTVLIGPDITIPGLNDKPKAPATPKPDATIDSPKANLDGPMPASPSDFNTFSIERPQHGGVGPAVKAPLPGPDPDGTMRMPPPKQNPQEPV